jgi:iron complex transport system permease protein
VSRTVLGTILGGVFLLLVAFTSILVGADMLTPSDLLRVLQGDGTSAQVALVTDYRLPRTLIGIVVGAALAVAGGLIQAFSRNPLADPGILGVNAGAAFFVTLTIALVGTTSVSALIWPALAGAAVTTLAVLAIGGSGVGPATPMRMTLAGVAIAAFLGGLTSGLRLADPTTFDRMRNWSAGAVTSRSLSDLVAVLPYIVGGLVIALLVTRGLNAIALGEDLAAGLGTRVRTTRTLTVVAITLLAGSATALAGPIGFVGLMVPHVVRWLVGPDQRRILPLSALGGAILLVTSDVLSRIMLGQEIPVGVVSVGGR